MNRRDNKALISISFILIIIFEILRMRNNMINQNLYIIISILEIVFLVIIAVIDLGFFFKKEKGLTP